MWFVIVDLIKFFGRRLRASVYMDLKESCTTEERIIAVVGDGGRFVWIDEVAEHPPVCPERT